MKDTEPTTPDTLLFDVYRGLNRGKALIEASEALAQCTAAALEHGKKATLTLTLTVAPLKDHDEAVEIIDTIDKKLPKAKRKPRMLFATPEGMLTTERADQDSFSFERDASIVQGAHTPEPKPAKEEPAKAANS
jgi:hypothetical protein